MKEFEFSGFERPAGRAGTRNHMLLLSVTGLTTPTCRHAGARLKGAIALGTGHGGGHVGIDAEVHGRCLIALACHPNVGAVVVIGADPTKIEPVVRAAEAAGREVAGFCLDDFQNDALKLGDAAIRAGAGFLKSLSPPNRRTMPGRELALGLECGRSDPSSGLVANPLVGRMADLIVDAGGVAMIGETTEWLGAEHVLTDRAVNPEVAQAIGGAAKAREQTAIDAGMDLLYNNPNFTNIQAGLTTIEEKSLGAVAKSGSRLVKGMISYGVEPAGPGLWVMDAPHFAPESLTGFTAAGCNLALFTTGVGNSYTSALMPTIKLTANPETASRLQNQLDFTAARVFTGEESMDDAGERLSQRIAMTASGELTWGEVLGDFDEVISRFGASL